MELSILSTLGVFPSMFFYAYFEVLNKNRLMETTKFKIVAFAFSEKSRCTKVQIEIHLPNKFWW